MTGDLLSVILSLEAPLSPPPYYYSLINDTVSINHDCKTARGLIRDELFTNWKFGFVFDSRLHDLQLLVLELFHFALQFFMENSYHRLCKIK